MNGFAGLWEALLPLGRDARTGGYRRLAWTAADAECRAWFVHQAHARGLDVETDRNANLWAWWGKPGPGAVVTGSHLDSVPDGGAYDGPLGVVCALAAVDVLRARDVRPSRPLAVVVFSDEEGRFGVSCVGSRLLTGGLAPDHARRLQDADGVGLAQAMAAAGADPHSLGRDDDRLAWIDAFVELHIEQGRGLVDLGAPVGVATGIWPHGRWRLDFTGEANHAGTTRLADRRDPMLPLAASVVAARATAARKDAVATIGRVHVDPNATNAVPATARAWLDVRAARDDAVVDTVEGVEHTARTVGGQHGVHVTMSRASHTPAVDFPPDLRDRLATVLGGAPLLSTAAGHDAGVLASAVPTGMLFVRNPIGASHTPAEHATTADCLAGVAALATVLEDLACR